MINKIFRCMGIKFLEPSSVRLMPSLLSKERYQLYRISEKYHRPSLRAIRSIRACYNFAEAIRYHFAGAALIRPEMFRAVCSLYECDSLSSSFSWENRPRDDDSPNVRIKGYSRFFARLKLWKRIAHVERACQSRREFTLSSRDEYPHGVFEKELH